MKTFAFLAGLAIVRQAAAACCRSNQCLKAIGEAPLGTEDCSTNLLETLTPETVTVTETRAAPTAYDTVVDTQVVTETETSTASTETDVITVSTTIVVSTETGVEFTTETVWATETDTETVLVATTTVMPLRRQAVTTSAASSQVLPSYASQCLSWANYVSACKCAGVTSGFVSGPAPTVTVTVDAASTLTDSVLLTATSTETAVDAVTATISSTQTDVVSVTVTTLTTQTAVQSETVTVSATQTQETTAEASLVTHDVAPFEAIATDYNASPYAIFANVQNPQIGSLNWQPPTTLTTAAVVDRYLWKIDSNGRLVLAYGIPPYTFSYSVYISTASSGSVWLQYGQTAQLESSINSGAQIDWVYGSVDPATNRLYLNGGLGRKNILSCALQVRMSSGNGSDLGTTCVTMHPTISYYTS